MTQSTQIPTFFNSDFESFTVGSSLKNSVTIDSSSLTIIAGPCAIENYDHAHLIASKLQELAVKHNVGFIYKSCFDKDCRSSSDSFHGVGIESGSSILESIRSTYQCPVVSDFSIPEHAPLIAPFIDLIQVPAYLCRQTSILRAAANTGLPIHLKKGQFMSPWNMKNSVRKLRSFGCSNIICTDRGTFFGYNMLVNDLKSLKVMSDLNCPVCYDATHSIQLPTSMGSVSGGQREFIPFLVRAAVASGINALFFEVHDDPPNALSDPNTVIHLDHVDDLLLHASTIHRSLLSLK